MFFKNYIKIIEPNSLKGNNQIQIFFNNNLFKYKMRRALLLSMLTLLVFSLHYKSSIYYEKTYLNNLDEIQNKFLSNVAKLKERVQKAKSEISQSGDMAKQIAIYQEALADQRDLLSKIQSYIVVPFDTKLCECGNFTESQKSAIMKTIQLEEASLRKFKDNVAQRQNCSNINELNRQIIKEEQYISAMKDVINSDCKRLPRPFIQDRPLGLVNLKQYLLISNLDASKWIYGSLTEAEYRYRMFVWTTKNNLTQCPIDKPYALSNKECVACTDDHPIWDLSTLQCTSCAAPEKYNPYGHNCTTKEITETDTVKTYRVISMNSNPAGENYVSRPPENNPVVATCPKEAPFSDGSKCIRCDLPKIFNYNSLHCQACPEGQQFDMSLKKCAFGSVVMTTTTENQSPEGEYLTNLNARNLLAPQNSDFQAIVKIQRQLRESKGNSIPLCSADRPYYNGKRCIPCYGDTPLFDLNRLSCTNCMQGFTYFSNLHKCTKNIRVTNAQAPNILETTNYNIGKLYQSIETLRNQNPNVKIQNCAILTPFEKDNECISCPLHNPLYNLETKACSRCPEGQYYDPHDKICQKYSRITSPKSPNLYFKGTTKQQYEIEYKQAKESDPTIIDCPDNAPYFNGKTCISCNAQNPIFSVYVKLCGKCPLNRVYDTSTGQCKSTEQPTTVNTTPNVPVAPQSSDNRGGAVFSLF